MKKNLLTTFCSYYLPINQRALLLFVLTFLGINSIHAQNKTVTLQSANSTIKQVITEIEKQTDYLFIYDNNEVNLNAIVSVNVKNEKVEKVLTNILKNTGLRYVVENRNIMLMKVSEKLPEQTQTGITIKGKVSDKDGDPLIGVSVVEKGTQNGQTTDLDGNFTIQVKNTGSILAFSYVGYKSMEQPIEKTFMNVVFQEGIRELDEVVVIGYTTQRKGSLTGSVVSMNVDESLKELPVTSAGNIMTGKLAGVYVSTPIGVPGSNPNIEIRTKSSLNKTPVIYVIDGVVRTPEDFNNLSPNEIDDIIVLKDAASAAIYGSRSSGGVILVTTKRGKLGKPSFNYSYSFGVDTRTKNAELTSAIQTGELYNRINGDSDPAGWKWSQEELDHYKTINNGWGYDQLDAVWKNPSIQNHNLSVSGGSEKVRYFSGLSYAESQGFLEPLKFDKLNFRLNMTVDITKELEFFAGMGLTMNNKGSITWEGHEGLYPKLLRWQPDQPVFTDGGQYVDYGWLTNVGGEVEGAGGYKKNRFLKPQIVLNMTYKLPFIKGLSVKGAYSSNWGITLDREFRKNFDVAVLKRSGPNRHIVHTDDASITEWRRTKVNSKDNIYRKMDWGQDYQINAQVNYNRTFNNLHQVQGAFVYERTGGSGLNVEARRETFPVYLTDQFWAASDTKDNQFGNGSTDWNNGRVSWIGQFNYSYANKYLLNFSFREDGSMKFAKGRRWGFFPAGSVGWVVSEESFFKNKVINFLKFRASVGLTGNDDVGDWEWQETYKSSGSTYFGKNPSKQTGITYGKVPNLYLTWEKSLSYNFAVDFNFLRHWNATFEYWQRKTYDILDKRGLSIPSTLALDLPKENYAKTRTQGFDFNIGYKNNIRNFNYSVNLNLSYGWNKILLQDHAQNAKWYDIPNGRAFSGSMKKGYRFDRIIRTPDELDAFVRQNPNYKFEGVAPEAGMMVYKDLSGPNGQPDGVIDAWDRDILVTKNFPVIYGLNLGASWKGLSLDIMFNGKLGEKKSYKDLADGVEWNRMWTEWYNNSWTPEHTNSMLPRRFNNDSPKKKTYTTESDYWLKDASFIRLKYINVGYTIPPKLYRGVLDRVKVFFSGTNLFVLSNFKYYDPEMGDGVSFPITRTYSFGIDIKF